MVITLDDRGVQMEEHEYGTVKVDYQTRE